DQLRTRLKSLEPELTRGIKSIDDPLAGARRLPVLVGSLLSAAVVGLVLAVIILLLSSASTWTSESVASVVRTIPPHARSAICDPNTQLEGDYACSVSLPRCAIRVDAGKAPTKCSPSAELTYRVETEKSCYSAVLTGEVINRDPPWFL